MTPEDKTGLQLAKALDQLCVRHQQLTFAALKDAYKNLRTKALRAPGAPTLEIKRRIAECMLMAAIDKRRSVRGCLYYWHQLAKLGFSDLVRDCQYRLIFCRYLIKSDSKKRAHRLLSELYSECAKVQSSGNRKDIRQFMPVIERLLKEIEAKDS